MAVSDYLCYFVVLTEFGAGPSSFRYVVEEILVFSSLFLLLFFLFHSSIVNIICQLLFSRSARVKRCAVSVSECNRKNKSSSSFLAPTTPSSTLLENAPSPLPVKPHEEHITPSSSHHTLPIKGKQNSEVDALIDGALNTFFLSEALLDELVEKI